MVQERVLLQVCNAVPEGLRALVALDDEHGDGTQDICVEHHIEEQVDGHDQGLRDAGRKEVTIAQARKGGHGDVEGVNVSAIKRGEEEGWEVCSSAQKRRCLAVGQNSQRHNIGSRPKCMIGCSADGTVQIPGYMTSKECDEFRQGPAQRAAYFISTLPWVM